MISAVLVHTCTVQVRTVSLNTYGEPIPSWADEQEDLPCRFGYPKGKALRGIPGEEALANLAILLPSTITVTKYLRRITTSESGFAGTYSIEDVKAVPGRSSIHHYECDLKKIDATTEEVMRSGIATDVVDGSAITHDYSSAPTLVFVQWIPDGTIPPIEANARVPYGATTFTLDLKTNTGAPVTDPQDVKWWAIK